MVDRISTGTNGLDPLIEGGIPESSVNLVTGGPGSGKTTMCLQFLLEGLRKGEKCLYISTEENPEEIKADAASYGWNFQEFQDGGSLEIYQMEPIGYPQNIDDMVLEKGFDRIVLDSISVLGMYWDDPNDIRRNVNSIIKMFRELPATALITGEITGSNSEKLTRHEIAEYLVDGVIRLNGLTLGDATFRSLQVIKMRKTEIDGGIKPIKLDDDGLRIEEEEKV